jgi:phosphoenolpyruvate synthase/pyruvate phosphate dikinase
MARLRGLKDNPAEEEQATRLFLKRLREWILRAQPGDELRERLGSAMADRFGPDGSYGVFVRSDTNVEDLPGFTGAGLNLTVPHVVGFEKVWDSIRRVWASPFTERAYAWRQSHMADPEHVYVSVLLMKSVSAEKSGVMVTTDLERGRPGWITVAANEGVGGAVDGQAAEELRIHVPSGEIRLVAQATEPLKRVLLPGGGVAKIPVKDTETILGGAEISRLIELARTLPGRYPMLRDREGRPAPADVEFGFLAGRLVLFQIRPFLESARARQSRFLNSLDGEPEKKGKGTVELDQIPLGERK